MSSSAAIELPGNVAPNLVANYPFSQAATTYENPYDSIIPDIHKTRPAIFWDPQAWGGNPAWVLRRAEDIKAVYLDNEHFSTEHSTGYAGLVNENWQVLPLESNPPQHMQYRMVLSPELTPSKVAAMEERVKKHALTYINLIKNKHECEFVSEFSARFPIAVFLELFGLPMDDVEQFLEWEQALMMRDNDLDKIADTIKTVKAFLMAEVEKRRNDPKDDLITRFTQAQFNGRPANDDEIFGLCFNLFLGGLDTVTNSLGWYFRYLASHPDQQELLRNNPKKIPAALDEFLRAFSISTTARVCTKTRKIGNVSIQPGDIVLLNTAIASNDPELHNKPWEVQLDRNNRHMAFGSGVHNCVGLRLARRELHIALQEFLSAIPSFRIKPGAKILTYLGNGPLAMETLPLVWD
jgi:cytochrome P450